MSTTPFCITTTPLVDGRWIARCGGRTRVYVAQADTEAEAQRLLFRGMRGTPELSSLMASADLLHWGAAQ